MAGPLMTVAPQVGSLTTGTWIWRQRARETDRPRDARHAAAVGPQAGVLEIYPVAGQLAHPAIDLVRQCASAEDAIPEYGFGCFSSPGSAVIWFLGAPIVRSYAGVNPRGAGLFGVQSECKCLFLLVGVRGFEPPTPTSRT